MSFSVSQRFRDALAESHTAISEAVVVQNGEVVSDPLTLVDGGVTFDSTADVKLAGSMVAIDETGTLTPRTANDLLSPFGTELGISRGIEFSDGTRELVPLGIVRLKRLVIEEEDGAVKLTSDLFDRTIRAQSPLRQAFYIAAGGDPSVVIPDLIRRKIPTATFALPVTNLTLPALLIRENVDTWAKAQELAQSVGLTLGWDRYGVCVLYPTNGLPPNEVWRFVEGETATFRAPIREINVDDIPNVVIVRGTNSQAPGVYAEVADLNPDSVTYVHGPYGEVIHTIESEKITTLEQAQAVAASEFTARVGPAETIAFECIVNPAMDLGDLVALTRERMGLEGAEMTISQMVIPFRADSFMQVQAHRVGNLTLAGSPVQSSGGSGPASGGGGGGTGGGGTGGGTPAGPDMVVLSYSIHGPDDGDAAIGDDATFRVIIRNSGTQATPEGVATDAILLVDDVIVAESSDITTALGAGTSRELTLSGSWEVTAGSHDIEVRVNEGPTGTGRFSELTRANNTLTDTYTDGGSSEGGGGGGTILNSDVLLWCGVVDLDDLVSGDGGFTLADVANYYTGVVVSLSGNAEGNDNVPSWLLSEMMAAKSAGLKVFVGPRIGTPHPPNDGDSAARAAWLAGMQNIREDINAGGLDGWAYDAEPYGGSDDAWDGSDTAQYYAMGEDLADIMAGVPGVGYPSSNASWPDSNNYEILVQAYGAFPYYANSRYPSLLHGYFDNGGVLSILDASFHHGKQNSIPSTMAQAVARVVTLTEAEFPTSQSSVMFWPDIDEGSHAPPNFPTFFDASTIESWVNASVTNSTGPTVIYHHRFTTGEFVAYWQSINEAVLAGRT